jgi:hypothetical protein
VRKTSSSAPGVAAKTRRPPGARLQDRLGSWRTGHPSLRRATLATTRLRRRRRCR